MCHLSASLLSSPLPVILGAGWLVPVVIGNRCVVCGFWARPRRMDPYLKRVLLPVRVWGAFGCLSLGPRHDAPRASIREVYTGAVLQRGHTDLDPKKYSTCGTVIYQVYRLVQYLASFLVITCSSYDATKCPTHRVYCVRKTTGTYGDKCTHSTV